MILAKNYPEATTMISSNFSKLVSEKELENLYLNSPTIWIRKVSGEIKFNLKRKNRLSSYIRFLFREKRTFAHEYFRCRDYIFYYRYSERDSFDLKGLVLQVSTRSYGLEKTKNSPILFEDRNLCARFKQQKNWAILNKSRIFPINSLDKVLSCRILSYLSIRDGKGSR